MNETNISETMQKRTRDLHYSFSTRYRCKN